MKEIRGYDEYYKEYGPEDDDFNQRIGRINELVYTKDIISMHLYHPRNNRNFETINKQYYTGRIEYLKNGTISPVVNKKIWGKIND